MSFLSGIGKAIGGALLGGFTSGLSKRVDAQIGGKKAALYGGTPSGGQQQIQHHHSREYQSADHTQQTNSQGQVLAHQTQMREMDHLAESARQWNQQQHELRMQRDYFKSMGALNGDQNNGDAWWQAPRTTPNPDRPHEAPVYFNPYGRHELPQR